MKPQPIDIPEAPLSEQELEIVEVFIRHQSGVVIRSCRMECAQANLPEAPSKWRCLFLPWTANRELSAQVKAFRKAAALQLILEKQLAEALAFLSNPNEETRDQFAMGAFRALFSCEKYAYGNKASYNIQNVINQIGLQIYK